MLQLVNFLQSININSLLYAEEGKKLSSTFISYLIEHFPKIWFVVLTTKLTTDTGLFKVSEKITVIKKDELEYKFSLKFDAAIVPLKDFVANEDLRNSAKCVISLVPYYLNLDALQMSMYNNKQFNDIIELFLPNAYISALPLKVQLFLSRFKLFADKKVKYIIGKI